MTTETNAIELSDTEQAANKAFEEEILRPKRASPPNEMISTPDGAIRTGIQRTTDGRWFKAWDTQTGEMSLINKVHEPFLNPNHRQAWKYPNGKMRFSLSPIPNLKPVVGTLACMLHKDHPKRQHMNEIGLANVICQNSPTIPSGRDVRRHMQKRHPDEWAIIQDDIEDTRLKRAEAREDALLSLVQANAVTQPAPVPAPEPEVEKPIVTKPCDVEGCDFMAESTAHIALPNIIKKHHREAHVVEEA